MAESYPKEQKTLRENDKLLVTISFSFSHSVFKRLVQQTSNDLGLFGKRINQLKYVCEIVLHLDLTGGRKIPV